MDFETYKNKVLKACPKEQRQGQWAFNLLYQIRPELTGSIHDTDLDPFYQDSRLNNFFNWLQEIW